MRLFRVRKLFLLACFVFSVFNLNLFLIQSNVNYNVSKIDTYAIPNSSALDINANLTSDYVLNGIELIGLNGVSNNSINNYTYYLNSTEIRQVNHTDSGLYFINSTSQSIEETTIYQGYSNSSDYSVLNYNDGDRIKLNSNQSYGDLDGHYKGVFTFRNNTIGQTPSDWEASDSSKVKIMNEYKGHKNVMYIEDTSNSIAYSVNKSFIGAESGIVEFWLLSSKTTELADIWLGNESTNQAIKFSIKSNEFYAYNDSVDVDIANAIKDVWYHIKIVFNSSIEKYDLYIDNVLKANQFDYMDSADQISSIKIETDPTAKDFRTYIDSFSPVWLNNENYTYYENDLLDLEQGIQSEYQNLHVTFMYDFTNILQYQDQIESIDISYAMFINDSSRNIDLLIEDFAHNNFDKLLDEFDSTTLTTGELSSTSQSRIHYENGYVNLTIESEEENSTTYELIIDELNVTINFYQLDGFNIVDNWLFDSTTISDGDYTLRVLIEDNNSEICEFNKSVKVDNTEPNVITESITSYQNEVNFDLSYNDTTTNISLSNSYIYWVDLQSLLENRIYLNDSSVNFNQTFGVAGIYNFSTHIEDYVGNTYENSTILNLTLPVSPIEEQRLVVFYSAINQIGNNGSISVIIENIDSWQLKENGTSILNSTINSTIIITKLSIGDFGYELLYETDSGIHSYSFVMKWVNLTLIESINQTIIINKWFTLSIPTILPLDVNGNISITTNNIDFYEIYENGTLIFNKTGDFEFSVNSSDITTKFYQIFFHTIDSGIFEQNFTIQFSNITIGEPADPTPTIPIGALITILAIGSVGFIGTSALAGRVSRNPIITKSLSRKKKARTIYDSGKGYAKKNSIDIAELQRNNKNWFNDFLQTPDGQRFNEEINLSACKRNLCTKEEEKAKSIYKRILKAGLEKKGGNAKAYNKARKALKRTFRQ